MAVTSPRHLWLFLALLLPLLSLAAPPVSHQASEASCAHCHTDPHAGTAPSACESCHVTVAWSPSTFDLIRHAATAFPLEGKHQEVSCARCHTGNKLTGLPMDCAGCHVDRHRGKLGADCTDCHSVQGFAPVQGFDHAVTGFTLTGPHDGPACADCHEGDNGEAMTLVAEATCATCHASSHGEFRKDCESCHREEHTAFSDARDLKVFDHASTSWPLERHHGAQACASCHPAGENAPLPICSTCHADPHAGQAGPICGDCHRDDRWTLVRFDHNMTSWPLRGKHSVVACRSCHKNQRWIGLNDACSDCHAQAAARANAVFPHPFSNTECQDCHNLWSFSK